MAERELIEAEPELIATAAAMPAAAVTPAAARVLGLQRSAGNRAVTALLSRQAAPTTPASPGTVSSTTDPRLGYRGRGVPDTPGLDRQALPFTNPSEPLEGWDWQTILDNLTQHDETTYTFSDEVRCGANAALAIAIMYGPRQVISFAGRVQRLAHARQAGLARLGANPTPAQIAAQETALDNVGAEAGALFGIDAISRGYATYSTLSDIAHAAKVAMTSRPHGHSFGREVQAMAAAAGSTTRVEQQITSRVQFAEWMSRLGEREAYIVHVDTDVLAENATPAMAQGNHFVVVGQEPGDFGNHFLYDPFPRTGRQYMTSLSEDFWTVFETSGGRWKWVWIESKTSPPQ